MRTLMCALVLGLAIGLGGCKKKEVAEEPPEAAPAATPTAQPATPEPKHVAVATPTPPPATPAPEFAPSGVFYLISAVSVETSDGILGLKPGQLLREVRSGVYRADNNEVTLRPDQVTNDLAVARRVAVQDQKMQAAIQQRLAATTAPSAPATGAQSGSTPPPPAPNEDPATSARQQLFHQKQALLQQASQLAVSLNQASGKWGGNWEIASKKSPQVFQLLQQYNALQRQITDVDGQMLQIH